MPSAIHASAAEGKDSQLFRASTPVHSFPPQQPHRLHCSNLGHSVRCPRFPSPSFHVVAVRDPGGERTITICIEGLAPLLNHVRPSTVPSLVYSLMPCNEAPNSPRESEIVPTCSTKLARE
ncbi:hypothetical protein EJ04DRAFT_96708 [Polyplosphaeria fusca]|uniref:Uncharacterized protein n=1 Tax=Polyplosphaeria fusca TaxID=682080 RepID=A0A9P4QL48_9PLEO|nr:hypothetical protein EJ04DRAFT_96708 [Polyplosphaeria fusca]